MATGETIDKARCIRNCGRNLSWIGGVSWADIQASNDIVHVVYEVLLPSYIFGENGLPG